MAIVLLLAGCTSSAGGVPETPLVEHAVEQRPQPNPTQSESEGSACMPFSPAAIADRLALIELAAERLDHPECSGMAAGRSIAVSCQAIWLASVLDPVELWLDEVAPDDRQRAADVVDRAIAAALVELDPTFVDETRALERLRVLNAEISSLFNDGVLDEIRLAELVTARSDDEIIEPLRALERACNLMG